MKKLTFLTTLFAIFIQSVIAQSLGGFQNTEANLYAMNKQVGQFVRRFNMEEDEKGKRLMTTDNRYRNNDIRTKVLPSMFDNYNERTSGKLKTFFIDDVTSDENPVYLNFLDVDWYAEVSATFIVNGKNEHIILFLTLQEENLGSKWIISNVYFKDFSKMFPKPDSLEMQKHFLHPQSHELDFMNLKKALEDQQYVELYASSDYQPDYLTHFFYLMKLKKMELKLDLFILIGLILQMFITKE